MKKIKITDTQQGWVKLERSLLDSPIMKNPRLLQIYVWCNLKANHQTKWISLNIGGSSKEFLCEKGQFITGRKRASDELGVSESTWYNNIKRIERYGYLKLDSNNHFTLVTVVNSSNLRKSTMKNEQQIKQRKNNRIATKEQQKNTNNNYEKEKKENNNKRNYLLLFKSKSYKKLNEKIQSEYTETVNFIQKELDNIILFYQPIKPLHYSSLRKSFSKELIKSALININVQNTEASEEKLINVIRATLGKPKVESGTGLIGKTDEAIISKAFDEITKKINNDLPNVLAIPRQLNLKTFTTLFVKYHMKDIERKLSEVNEWPDSPKQKSVSEILKTFLFKDTKVKPIKEKERNSYFNKYDKEKKVERLKDIFKSEKERTEEYYQKVKESDVWSELVEEPTESMKWDIVFDYLRLNNQFKSDEYENFKKIESLNFEDIVRFDDSVLEVSGIELYLDKFHNWKHLSKPKSTKDFLKQLETFIQKN